MSTPLDHGQRLSQERYERAIAALHASPHEDRDSEEVRRQELMLAIDHRLGCEFPTARRETLWAIQQRAEKRRGRLILKYLLKRLVGKSIEPDTNRLAGWLVEEYAQVLNADELQCFLGDDPE